MNSATNTDIAGSISSFLLELEPLTIHFWVVMFFVTIAAALVAVLFIFRAMRQLPELEMCYRQNENNSASDEPTAYLQRRLGVESLQLLLEPVPAILLTLGILGTFLGLGVAISQAAPALAASSDPASVRTALTKLLHTVSFKFQVSAWGVIFSLAFPFVVRLPAEFLIRHKIQQAAKRLMTAHQPPQLKVVLAIERSFGRLDELFRDNIQAMTQGSQEMSRQVLHLANSVTELKTSVSQSSSVLGSTAQHLSTVGRTIDLSLQNVAVVIGNKLDASQRSLVSSLDSFSKDAKGAHLAQANQLSQQLSAINGQMSNNLSTMSGNLQNSLSAQTTAAQQQSTAFSKHLNDFSNEIKKADAVQKSAIEAQAHLLTSNLSTMNTQLVDSLSIMRNGLLGSLDAQAENTRKMMDDITKQSHAASQKQTDAAQQQSTSLSNQLDEFRKTLEKHLTNQQSVTNNMGAQLKVALDNINKYQADLNVVLRGQEESSKEFNRHIGTLLTLLQQIQGRDAATRMQGMAGYVAKTTSSTSQNSAGGPVRAVASPSSSTLASRNAPVTTSQEDEVI